METRNTGFFYVNAVELKMKVFMTCKVPLSTPHFGRFGKLRDLNKKIAMAIEYSAHHYNSKEFELIFLNIKLEPIFQHHDLAVHAVRENCSPILTIQTTLCTKALCDVHSMNYAIRLIHQKLWTLLIELYSLSSTQCRMQCKIEFTYAIEWSVFVSDFW